MNDKIGKAIESGILSMWDIPLQDQNDFISFWKQDVETRRLKDQHGLLINIERTDNGINVLSVGERPEWALFIVGVAVGRWRTKTP